MHSEKDGKYYEQLVNKIKRAKPEQRDIYFQQLLNDTKGFSKSICSRLRMPPQISQEEIDAAIAITTNKAVLTFDRDKSYFLQFLQLALRGAMNTLLSQHYKRSTINGIDVFSLHAVLSGGRHKDSESHYQLSDPEQQSPLDILIEQEESERQLRHLEDYASQVMPHLSPLEQSVFRNRLSGMTYREIHELSGVSIKQIDNTVCRIRRKIALLQQDGLEPTFND